MNSQSFVNPLSTVSACAQRIPFGFQSLPQLNPLALQTPFVPGIQEWNTFAAPVHGLAPIARQRFVTPVANGMTVPYQPHYQQSCLPQGYLPQAMWSQPTLPQGLLPQGLVQQGLLPQQLFAQPTPFAPVNEFVAQPWQTVPASAPVLPLPYLAGTPVATPAHQVTAPWGQGITATPAQGIH